MENNVSIRLAGSVITADENGKFEFESGSGMTTKLDAEEVHNRLLQAQSFEDALSYLQESGAYIGTNGSRVMIVSTPDGTMIFSKDEPSRKTVINKDIPETVMSEILSINDYDNGRAVEKILVANRIIEDPEKEVEESITLDRDNLSFEHEADNIGNTVRDGGEIAAARDQRDMLENPYNGIISEEERRRREEERRREIRKERSMNREDGMDR